MEQAELEALLGRPLTTIEVANLELYLDIATQKLEEMLCTTLASVTETREYDTREGYSTAFVDLFTELDSVVVGDDIVDPTTYSARQWDKRTATWYNSIVFDVKQNGCTVIGVTADWGFETLPNDLQQVLAKLFDLVSSGTAADSNVASKQVEDFRVTFQESDLTAEGQLSAANQMTISKYSLCSIGEVRHGRVCIRPIYHL